MTVVIKFYLGIAAEALGLCRYQEKCVCWVLAVVKLYCRALRRALDHKSTLVWSSL